MNKEINLFSIEQWRDIKDFEGLYQVSTLGRVRSLDRWVWNAPKQAYSLRKGRILKSQLDRKGYQYVILYKDGKMKHYKVHRLVAQTFIPNLQNFKEVNHLDEDKTNNRAENLEWCSRIYNCNYGTRKQKASIAMTNGKTSKRLAQINPQTNEIIKIWPSTNECGRNGYNQGSVAACCRGERKIHKGYRWQYVD